MAQVVWTAEAQRWLRDIHNYIAEDNPAPAERVAPRIAVGHCHQRAGL
jgi:plasmid stabilization system protein ParE